MMGVPPFGVVARAPQAVLRRRVAEWRRVFCPTVLTLPTAAAGRRVESKLG